jgi:hypothetical protein
MSAYEIRLSGCDDSTSFPMELTDAEAGLLQRAAALSKGASEFGCQPTMTVVRLADVEPDTTQGD